MSNQLPNSWNELRLGDITQLITKGTTPKEYISNGINFVKVESVSENTTLLSSKFAYISNAVHAAFKRSQLKDGDILFSIAGSLGRIALIENKHLPANTNQALAIIRLSKGIINVKFCIQQLKSDTVQLELKKLQTVGAQPNLSLQQVSDISVPLPPLQEQQKIAAILTSVDDVIEKTQAQINKLKDLKTGMMQELLTRGVGVGGKPHTEFKDSPVGRIPKAWDVVQISELCTDVVDCVNKTAPVVDYKTPYKMLRTTNIKNGRVDTDNVRCVTKETYHTWTRRMKPESGDLIFTREAPVGECGVLKDSKGVFLGQRTMMYRANKTKTSSGYLMYSLMSEYGQKQLENFSGGSTVPHMRVPDCSKILIKLPSLKEQRIIVDSLNSLDFSRQKKEQKVSKLSSLKKALMQDLLTGKKRVKVDS